MIKNRQIYDSTWAEPNRGKVPKLLHFVLSGQQWGCVQWLECRGRSGMPEARRVHWRPGTLPKGDCKDQERSRNHKEIMGNHWITQIMNPEISRGWCIDWYWLVLGSWRVLKQKLIRQLWSVVIARWATYYNYLFGWGVSSPGAHSLLEHVSFCAGPNSAKWSTMASNIR